MLGPRQTIPRLQSDFYREQFYRLLRWTMVLIGVMFLLIAIIIYSILAQPPVDYYGNTTDGLILPMPTANTG
jgi:hypothetical protein